MTSCTWTLAIFMRSGKNPLNLQRFSLSSPFVLNPEIQVCIVQAQVHFKWSPSKQDLHCKKPRDPVHMTWTYIMPGTHSRVKKSQWTCGFHERTGLNNQWFSGQLFDSLQFFWERWLPTKNLSSIFLRTMVMNPKNCPDNRWGSAVPVSKYCPTLVFF